MKLGSQLKVPFELGDLVKIQDGEELIICEVNRIEGDSVILSWGCPLAWRTCNRPWWSGLTLVRPDIRGYPYERKVPGLAWALFWIRYLPYRLWRGLRFRR